MNYDFEKLMILLFYHFDLIYGFVLNVVSQNRVMPPLCTCIPNRLNYKRRDKVNSCVRHGVTHLAESSNLQRLIRPSCAQVRLWFDVTFAMQLWNGPTTYSPYLDVRYRSISKWDSFPPYFGDGRGLYMDTEWLMFCCYTAQWRNFN